MARSKQRAQAARISASEIEYLVETERQREKDEAQRQDAESKAAASIAGPKRRPKPHDVLELLDQCNLPPSVRELARRALMGVKTHRPSASSTLGTEGRPVPRKMAASFEAQYWFDHGKPPSASAVSRAAYKAGTQRKLVDKWRTEPSYLRQIEAEIAVLTKKVAEGEDSRRAAREHRRVQDRPGLLRAMKKAQSAKNP